MDPLLVPVNVTEALVTKELDEARAEYGHLFKISDLKDGRLFIVTMKSLPIAQDDNTFSFLFDCHNYKLWPPLIRMVSPTVEDINSLKPEDIDTFNAYPQGPQGDAIFNQYEGKPVICKEFNRGAYDYYNGIHKQNWMLPLETSCEFDWIASNPAQNNLTAIFYYFLRKLNEKGFCQGRKKP